MADTTSAGTVSLTVKPDAGGFGNALSQQLKGTVGGVGESVGSTLLSGLKAFAGPIIAVTAGLGVKSLIDDSVQAFETLAGSTREMQRIVGGTTEQVSGLRGAMQLAGVDADTTTASFRIFSKNLEGAMGNSEATAALTDKLGTSFLDASGNMKPMSDLLPSVADKFASMPNGIEKTALASELFGRQGTALIPILNKGSSGIEELTQKAKDMGLVLDDASMKSFADSRASARDFSAAIQGVKVSLGSDLLPIIDAVQNIFRNAFTPVLQATTKFLQDHRQAFVDVAEAISSFGSKAGGALSSFFGPTMSTIGQLFANLGPTFMALLPQVMQLFSAFSPIGLLFKTLAPVLPQLIELLGGLAATLAGALGSALQVILPVLTNLVTMLVTTLSGVVMQLMPTFTNLITMLGPILSNVIATLVPVIVNLIGIIGPMLQSVLAALAPYWGTLASLIGTVFEAIVPLIPTLLGLVMAFVPLIPPILELVASLLPPLIELFTTLVIPIMHLAVNVFQAILIPILQIVIGVITWMVTNIIPPLIGAFEGIGSVVTAVFGGIASFVKGVANFAIDMLNNIFDLINPLISGGPIHDFLGTIGIKVSHLNHIPHLAEGGIVAPRPGGQIVKVAEAGEAEAVIPLSKLSQMQSGAAGSGQTIIYNAAPNQSLDSQNALFDAMRRARLLAGW